MSGAEREDSMTPMTMSDQPPRRSRTPHEEHVELEDDNLEEDDDLWGAHLENLEKGQQTIQRNLEEVMLTIPEIMICTI
ncbi:UNVERIFIED_CONTAM: hypothetical protein K2H54_068694 [Gekko kuhli]